VYLYLSLTPPSPLPLIFFFLPPLSLPFFFQFEALKMASSNSTESGTHSHGRCAGPRMYCYHNEVAPLRVVKHNGPNQGKQFYGCPHWPQKTCGFFKWTHEVQNVDDLQYMVLEKDTALIELEHEKKTLKKEVEELKAENEKLEDMVAKLSIENNETRLFMEATMADKKLAVALIISWVFFAFVFFLI
ncbi:DNA topoisomerase 3-alpha, partial [Bienertia sinuspersici]